MLQGCREIPILPIDREPVKVATAWYPGRVIGYARQRSQPMVNCPPYSYIHEHALGDTVLREEQG